MLALSEVFIVFVIIYMRNYLPAKLSLALAGYLNHIFFHF